MQPIVEVRNIDKSFQNSQNNVEILNSVHLSIPTHSLTVLRGRSGSGKTTLLNLIGALDQPSNGEIIIDGEVINKFSEKQKAALRRMKMSYIFQSYGLMPLMTVEENVEFGLRIAGTSRKQWKQSIKESIDLVGLTKRAKHKPFELSGGEQQRVAIARAIAIKPKLILADEPTAELDSKMAFRIIDVFKTLVKNKTTTIIMTTHDPGIMEIVDHVYTLEDRKIVYQKEKTIH
ncbi:ABC transporter ATP-binding protein [Gracilibacillus sp. D59]|uniref:ABC transporter ATP-binding protein n=1 Tax=Gracilibacillus sp. D59 TaxID=3457434 RepID=UPI003FCE7655